MKQIVVIVAIEKYAELCLQQEGADFDSPLLNGEAWLRACREVLAEIHDAYVPGGSDA
jgi:hypothetical protein